MSSCGFIGLGDQGAPIARRMIAAGFPTILWARRATSLASFESTDARFAETVAELGRAADHVGICVVNDDDVREVCAQLLPTMRKGSRVAVQSTIHPDTCSAMADRAAEYGVALIDAPVSGGAPAAEAGVLTLMLSPLAQLMAGRWFAQLFRRLRAA